MHQECDRNVPTWILPIPTIFLLHVWGPLFGVPVKVPLVIEKIKLRVINQKQLTSFVVDKCGQVSSHRLVVNTGHNRTVSPCSRHIKWDVARMWVGPASVRFRSFSRGCITKSGPGPGCTIGLVRSKRMSQRTRMSTQVLGFCSYKPR